MLCINTFGRVRYFPDQAKKKIQNGRTSTLNNKFKATKGVCFLTVHNFYSMAYKIILDSLK